MRLSHGSVLFQELPSDEASQINVHAQVYKRKEKRISAKASEMCQGIRNDGFDCAPNVKTEVTNPILSSVKKLPNISGNY